MWRLVSRAEQGKDEVSLLNVSKATSLRKTSSFFGSIKRKAFVLGKKWKLTLWQWNQLLPLQPLPQCSVTQNMMKIFFSFRFLQRSLWRRIRWKSPLLSHFDKEYLGMRISTFCPSSTATLFRGSRFSNLYPLSDWKETTQDWIWDDQCWMNILTLSSSALRPVETWHPPWAPLWRLWQERL